MLMAGNTYLNWCKDGRPRNNELFEAIKTSRSAFQNALKFSWRNELLLKRQILFSKFEQKKLKKFGKWREKLK